MNAWTIYWILQLDSINGLAGIVAILSAIAFIILFVGKKISADFAEIWADSPGHPEYKRYVAKERAATRALKPAAVCLAVFATVSAFLPSTRTAAAMVVLPAIANNETVQREAGDLYQLAKEALRNAAAPKQDKKYPPRRHRSQASRSIAGRRMAEFVVNSDCAEEWRDIPGHDGHYQASSLGRIRSMDREGKTCYGSIRKLKGRILHPHINKAGYCRVHPNVTASQFVHRLVALAFIPNPEGHPVINHKDGNPRNNRPENLEWCTQMHNVHHALDIGLATRRPVGKGDACIASKLTEAQVKQIKTRLKAGERICDMVADYPVGKTAISEIAAGRSWGHVQ